MAIYPRNTKWVDGVLVRYCKDCDQWYEANADNFFVNGLRYDTYCKDCRRKRDVLRRTAIQNLPDPAVIDDLRFIQEMTPDERRERNRLWCREKMRSLGLTPAKVRAYFGT